MHASVEKNKCRMYYNACMLFIVGSFFVVPGLRMLITTRFCIFSHKRLGVYYFKHELAPAFKEDPALIGDPALIILC